MTTLATPVYTPLPAPFEAERVPFLDLQAEYRFLAELGLETAILASLRQAQYIHGISVQSFERRWAMYCGAAEAVAVDSGTAALEIALKALGIGPGDEVIVPAHTFIATAAAVTLCGARPVFVDADPACWQISPALIENAITPYTRAVISVHLYGQPAAIEELAQLCRTYRLTLIEDAAQAQGATVNGRRVGSFGAAGCFSFYPAKNLGAFGDAGAITTDDAELASRIRRLCNHGRTTKYEHAEVGENLRMDELQGVVLDFKLPYLDGWNRRRREIAAQYRSQLRGLPIFIPHALSATEPVHHLFPIATSRRDELLRYLSSHNIDCGIHYPLPLHLQPAFSSLGYRRGQMPVAEWIGREELSFPIGPFMTDEQVDRVCRAVRDFFSN
jgi:dTDP-4-amino-4,6-dideoxygalactose transaminase